MQAAVDMLARLPTIVRITMSDLVVIALLGAVLAIAVVVARRRFTKGSECCGDIAQAPERVQVKDRDKRHYHHQITLSIGGMTCENCAIKVENALNELPGTWATVRIGSKQAVVRTKEEPDYLAMREAVASAGYVVL